MNSIIFMIYIIYIDFFYIYIIKIQEKTKYAKKVAIAIFSDYNKIY